MSDTPMPVTGFALDVSMSEDGQTIVALLTLQTGELTFEFAITRMGQGRWPATWNSFLPWWSREVAGPIDQRPQARMND
jgi:hypothetical protein